MPPAVLPGAARAVADFGIKLRQLVEFEERPASLEALLKDRDKT
jgi:hypothetical protein